MTTVWKYTVKVTSLWEPVPMPDGSRLVSVGRSDDPGEVYVWAIVNPSRPEVARSIVVTGTGHPAPENGVFVGTVDTGFGLIWHVWDLGVQS